MKLWRPIVVLLAVCLLGLGAYWLHAGDERLQVSLVSALTSPVTQLVLVFLAALVLLGLVLSRASVKLAGLLQRASRSIDGIRKSGGLTDANKREVVTSLPEKQAGGLLRERAEEFLESLVKLEAGYHNPEPSSDHFDDDEVVASTRIFRLPVALLDDLPSWMTGVGMLGTFVGIALGLGQIGAITDESSASLMTELEGVIVGLSTAFWTSIFGLTSSLIFSIVGREALEKLYTELGNYRLALDRLVPRVTTPKMLSDQVGVLKDIRDHGRASKEELQTIVNDLPGQLAGSFQAALGEVLAPDLSRMADAVAGQITHAQSAADDAAQRVMQEVLEGVGSALRESMGTMAESAKEFGANFDRAATQILEASKASQAALEQANERLLAERQLLDGYDQVTKRFVDAIQQFGTVLSDFRAVAASAERQAGASEVAAEELGRGVVQWSSASKEVISQLTSCTAALNASAQQLGTVATATHDWSEQATQAVERFGSGLKDAVEKSLTEYDKQLAVSVGGLRTVISELDDVARAMGRSIDHQDKHLASKAAAVGDAMAGLEATLRRLVALQTTVPRPIHDGRSG